MRTEQSLRDAYTELAASAPSTDELLRSLPRAARRPATRWYALPVAAAVAVLATGAALLVGKVATDGSTPPAPPAVATTAPTALTTAVPTRVTTSAPASSARSTTAAGVVPTTAAGLRFRFAITPNPIWSTFLNEISSATEQDALVELTADPTVGGTVAVRPQGSYAELKPTTGERVAINGRTTGYLFSQKGSGNGSSRLIWPYSATGWAYIQVDFNHALTPADRAKLITLAEHVSPTPESLPRAPFRLGYVPPGLTATSYLSVGSGTRVGFSDAAGTALQVSVDPEGAHGCPGELPAGRYASSLVLAGHTGCRISVDGPDGPPVDLQLDIPGGTLHVLVDETGSAGHVGAYSEKDLTRVLAEAVLVGKPGDPSTWGELKL